MCAQCALEKVQLPENEIGTTRTIVWSFNSLFLKMLKNITSSLCSKISNNLVPILL